MASSQGARANLAAQGLVLLGPTAAMAAHAEIVAHGTGKATVIQANWQRAAKALGGSRPTIFDNVLPGAMAEATGDSELLGQLHEIPEAQRGSFSPNSCSAKCSRSCGSRHRAPLPAGSWTWARIH